MCEAVDSFRQALAEQGLDAEVAHQSDEYGHSFYVSKTIDGERYTYNTTLTEEQLAVSDIQKQIVMIAEKVARQMKEQMTECLEWDDRRVEIDPHDTPEAMCKRCGTDVMLDTPLRTFSQSGELSTPQPIPVNDETALDMLSEHGRVMLKIYLVGMLQDECPEYCPNSNDRNLYM
jgi:hypothetical protein